jgi:tRNA threonylcarbamoyl adenosine modification protein YeaZ
LLVRVLAIDTALAACSVAVFDSEANRMLANQSLAMTRGHAEALMPLVERVMAEAGIAFTDIDRVAVTAGPGSFTGLRVGVAAARGIAVATEKPAIGITTLLAYAAPHQAEGHYPIVAAIDARNNHVYFQVFAPGGRPLGEPRLAPLREAVAAAAAAPARLVGSAAQTVASALSDSEAVPVSVEPRAAPDVAWVARLGALATDATSPPAPQYLRAPDAQPQFAAQLPRR